MEETVLKEAETICELMFPENEIGQCLLHHQLALFADYVEVLAVKRFRDEMNAQSKLYTPEEIRHG